jgi:O-antigen/teichoic acid export membrane protein
VTDTGNLARRTLRNTVLLFVARSLSKVLVLIAVIVTTNALGENRYGDFSTIVVLSNIASIVADLGLQVVYVREASRRPDQLGDYLAVTLAAKVPLAVIGGALLAAMTALLARQLLYLVPPVFALLVVTSLANLLRSSFYARGELGFEVVAIAGETSVLLAVTEVAAHTGGAIAFYIWAYTASYAFTVLFSAVVVQRRYTPLRLRWEPAALRRLLGSGLPFALAFVLSTIYFKIDTVILFRMRGDAQVGFYSAAYKFLEGLSFVPQAVMSAVFPALSVIHLQGRRPMRAAYTRAYRLLAALGMPLAIGTAVLAPTIVDIAYRASFHTATTACLQVLGVSLLLVFVNNSFIYALGAMDRQLVFALLTGLSVLVNVVLNVVMIPLFPHDQGYLASSWATLLTEMFLFGAGYVALAHYLGRLPWLRPTVPIAISGVVCAAVALALRHHAAAAVIAGGAAYTAAIVLTGGVSRHELQLARESLRLRRRPGELPG